MTDRNSAHTPIGVNTENNVAEQGKNYALHLFNADGNARLTYHNFQKAAEINALVKEIAAAEAADASVRQAAETAAWLYLTGYVSDPKNPAVFARKNLHTFAEENLLAPALAERILSCLQSREEGNQPRTEAAKIFSDAVNAADFTGDFKQKSALLRLESELTLLEQYSAADWTQLRLRQILNAEYYTAYAKETFAPGTAQNLLLQKSLTEKSRKSVNIGDDEATLRLFQNLERKLPERAVQTFFRANYRNHINLSQIADNKANIMISVNAILISVVLSIVSYQNISERNPAILAPVVIFVISGLVSLIFAVLSARPKVTALNKDKKTTEEIRKNVVYFGNFTGLTVRQFEEAMDAVLRDGELMYGNMIRDLYWLGKVLDKKYRLLILSYNIFMVGFATTVLFFLIALLL